MDNKQKELEPTLVLIKPDALKNSLTGFVLSQLSEVHSGLRFAGTKIVHVNRMLAEEHYAEHKGKAFFQSLLDYIMGITHYPNDDWKRRVIALVYLGPDAIKKIRELSGPTNPHDAREKRPGCIRSLGTVVPVKDEQGNVIGERMENLIHASANIGDAEREIKLWFKPQDIPPLMHHYKTVKSNEHYYYREGKLFTSYEKDSICLVAPGDMVWDTDMEALHCISQGRASLCNVATVAAKYLINQG